MRKSRVFVAFLLATFVSGSLLAAPPAHRLVGAKPSNQPAGQVSQLHASLGIFTGPMGQTIAAWAYRLAVRDLAGLVYRPDGIVDGPTTGGDAPMVKGKTGTVVSDVTPVENPGGH